MLARDSDVLLCNCHDEGNTEEEEAAALPPLSHPHSPPRKAAEGRQADHACVDSLCTLRAFLHARPTHMKTTKRSGTAAPRIHRQIICDPATLTRLSWIKGALMQRYRMKALQVGPTIIMRRALDLYAVHIEAQLRMPDGHDDPTKDRDLAMGMERWRLKDCASERDLSVPPELAARKPLRMLSEIATEAQEQARAQAEEQAANKGRYWIPTPEDD
jgi:hypothetical protein